jgi:ADP-ribosylglycohydrolase
MSIPEDYLERVYAGILGKVIGVYLGRPFEGWTYERILGELGPISYYVNEQLRKPLVVIDDDISGTFTFVRALSDFSNDPGITAAQIGETWLNYIIEERTTLWWGGFGNSTEHTAFLRLKQGTPAPLSGSLELNGRTVAEQIGAQIFIDSWAMVAPGDPGLAVELAGKAASVSHDGEAVVAAQLLAAMESQAFVEPDINCIVDVALSHISSSSLVARLVRDIRTWHAEDGDWVKTRTRIDEVYGYAKFKGNCHIIPNHAIVILSLLYSQDEFQRALMIANTCGWDTATPETSGASWASRMALRALMRDQTGEGRWLTKCWFRAPMADAQSRTQFLRHIVLFLSAALSKEMIRRASRKKERVSILSSPDRCRASNSKRPDQSTRRPHWRTFKGIALWGNEV